MATQYEKLYELRMRLKTAYYKLDKAQARVDTLEAQIAEITDKKGFDVT
jgi:division protein CdvB (Snf7/Vps24/ESCRT-III family)